MSNQSINIAFKVAGAELSSYIDSISKKSSQQASDAIKAATTQTDKAKEQLKIINETIAALEKKTRLESQASRSIFLERREDALNKNRDFFEGKKNTVYADTNLTDKQLKEKINAVSGAQQGSADKIKGDYKDNLTVIREQERQAKLQTQLSREQIDTVKQTARENVKAISSGDLKLADVINKAYTDEERLVAKLTEEGVKEDKKKADREKGNNKGLLDAVLKGEMIRSTGNMLGQIPQAKNELDFVKPLSSLLGMALGGAVGSLADTIEGASAFGWHLGQTSAGVIGMEMGKMAGDFVGGSLERAYRGREDLTNKNFALQALTGSNYGVDAFGSNNNGLGGTGKSRLTGNLSRYGLDYGQTADLELALAQKQGNGKDLYGGAQNVVGLEKGLGVSREAIFNIIELQRSASKENRDFLKTISGVLNAGKGGIFKDDRAMLSEFLGKYSQITKEFLKGQSTVGSATAFDVLNKFNSIGGEWSAKDPRSMGLINSVNNSLTNPNTDFKKALSFYALRKDNPNMPLNKVIEEQQKGLSSEKYFNSMLGLVDGMGGSESDREIQFAGLFGLEGSQYAAGDLYRGIKSGKKSWKTIQGNLKGGMSAGAVRGLGADQTGQYTKSTAEIQNMFVDDVAGAVSGVGDKMKILFGSMIGELETFIVNKIKGKETDKPFYNTNKKPYLSAGR